MFSQEIIREIGTVADEIGVERAALLAVAEVESGGRAFAIVNGRAEPSIRFEGHYFDRRLPAAKREVARAAGLAAPRAGAVANPAGQAARWALLARATAIDAKAAYESVSWGLGQVMGAHWAWLGYASVEALVAEARASVAGQARLMARYIDRAGLVSALRAGDWATFARGYNGPDYKRNGYDSKIATAYRRHIGASGAGATEVATPRGASPSPTPQLVGGTLGPGARGKQVAELQIQLTALGFPATPDGFYGPLTRKAVRGFQHWQGLSPDGIAGAQTLAALVSAWQAARSPGIRARLAGWLKRWPWRR